MRRGAVIASCAVPIAILFAGSNWVSMNLGYEYGADTSGCVAFDMLTDIPAAEIPMCDRAAATNLYGPRMAWLWLTDDRVLNVEIEVAPTQPKDAGQ